MKTKIQRIDLSKSLEEIKKTILRQREKTNAATKTIRSFSIVLLLFVTLSISAQSFDKINGIGKSYQTVIDSLVTINCVKFMSESTKSMPGYTLVNYFSNEFGLFGYAFKKNKCVRMVLPIESSYVYDLSDFNVFHGVLYNDYGQTTKVKFVE